MVPVLITSCHVSEKPKKGPLAAQMIITKQQIRNVIGAPAARATPLDAVANIRSSDMHLVEPVYELGIEPDRVRSVGPLRRGRRRVEQPRLDGPINLASDGSVHGRGVIFGGIGGWKNVPIGEWSWGGHRGRRFRVELLDFTLTGGPR